MSSHGEMAIREEAKNHDISAPSTAEQALGAPTRGQEVARRRYARETLYVACPKDAAVGTTLVLDGLAFPGSEYPSGVEVKSITARHSVAVTETTDVYAIDTFAKFDKDGTNTAVVATVDTRPAASGGLGTSVAHKRMACTLASTLASLQIAAGGCLAVTRTKTATGTAMPTVLYEVVIERL